MKKTPRLYVPAVTPFDEKLRPDARRFIESCRALLADGADGLAPFGTTSEANSMSVAERMDMLDVLVDGGIEPSRLIPGTGCAALPDTVALTRHAVSCGVAGVLMLPPFYYKGVPEAGLVDSYSAVLDGVGDSRTKIYLYHIPQMTGVPVTLSLIEALLAKHPGVFVGLKDSSGDWNNTLSIIQRFPELDVYSASEALVAENAATGGAGCISASANVNARNIKSLIDALGTSKENAIAAGVAKVRKIFEGLPLIPAIKAALALRYGDDGYAIVRPPFVRLSASHMGAIREAGELAFGNGVPA